MLPACLYEAISYFLILLFYLVSVDGYRTIFIVVLLVTMY